VVDKFYHCQVLGFMLPCASDEKTVINVCISINNKSFKIRLEKKTKKTTTNYW
jgi:hypothetical protein